MKKAYLAPSVEVIEIKTSSMLMQTSNISIISDEEKDSSIDGIQKGREDKISNPNLWDQLW